MMDVAVTTGFGSTLPSHTTVEPAAKFAPLTLSVNAGPQAVAERGEREVIAGLAGPRLKTRVEFGAQDAAYAMPSGFASSRGEIPSRSMGPKKRSGKPNALFSRFGPFCEPMAS